MSYNCISVEEVETVIGNADKTLNECFEMLMDFRHGRGKLENDFFKFQPLLAECLYDLMAAPTRK